MISCIFFNHFTLFFLWKLQTVKQINQHILSLSMLPQLLPVRKRRRVSKSVVVKIETGNVGSIYAYSVPSRYLMTVITNE